MLSCWHPEGIAQKSSWHFRLASSDKWHHSEFHTTFDRQGCKVCWPNQNYDTNFTISLSITKLNCKDNNCEDIEEDNSTIQVFLFQNTPKIMWSVINIYFFLLFRADYCNFVKHSAFLSSQRKCKFSPKAVFFLYTLLVISDCTSQQELAFLWNYR